MKEKQNKRVIKILWTEAFSKLFPKWEEEKTYSEEQVLDLLVEYSDFANSKEYVTLKTLEEWFKKRK